MSMTIDSRSGADTATVPSRTDAFLADLLAGLRRPRKRLPSKYFYDAEGSRLFERICLEAGHEDKSLSAEAYERLRSYRWPGNIRQLENALRRAVAFSVGPEVSAGDLPEQVACSESRSVETEHGPRRIIDGELLRQELKKCASSREGPTYLNPGHIDYARREYLRALIEVYQGSIQDIAAHWDRVNTKTVKGQITKLGLETEFEQARKK